MRFLYYTLFFLLPLLMYHRTSEIFEFNKMIFVYIVSILIGFLLILKFAARSPIIFKSWYFLSLLVFLFIMSLATIISIDTQTSLWGYYGRFNGGLISLVSFAVLAFGLPQAFTKMNVKRLISVSLISSFIVMLWGLPGKFGHDMSCFVFTGQFSNMCWTDQFRPAERMFSTLGQPNWMGAYLAILFFFALSLAFAAFQKRSKNVYLYTAYLVLNFTCILFTRSRSSLLAVVVGLVFTIPLYIYFYRDSKKGHRGSILFSSILLALFLLIAGLVQTGIPRVDTILRPSFTSSTPSSPTVSQPKQSGKILVTSSEDIRKIVWDGAIELGLKYPLLGTGLETFAYSYYFVRPVKHNLTSEWDYLYNKAHNEYLNYFATTGFLGTASYLFVIIASFAAIIAALIKDNQNRNRTIAVFGAYITILVTNFFGFSTSTVNLFFFTLPVLALLPSDIVPTAYASLGKSWVRILITIAASVIALYCIFVIASYWIADTKYKEGDDYYHMGDYKSSAYLILSAVNIRKEHVYEDKLSYILANYAASVDKDSVDKLLSLSDYYNQESLLSSPKNVLYWKTRAKDAYAYYQITQKPAFIDQGIQALTTAQALSPSDPKLPYTTAIFYSLYGQIKKGDSKLYEQKAIAEVNDSIKLKPDYRDAYILKSQLLEQFGKKKEAKETLEYYLSQIDPSDKEIRDDIKKLDK